MRAPWKGGRAASALWAAVVVLLVASLTVLAGHQPAPAAVAAGGLPDVGALGVPPPGSAPPLALVPTDPLPAPPPALPPLPPPPVEVPVDVPELPVPLPTAPAPAPAGLAAYRGLGTWVDVYDWSLSYTGGRPGTSPGDADQMAAVGVQTLYIQAARHDGPDGVLEPARLKGFLERARARGLRVVAWYLPSLVDPGADLRRLEAIAALPHVDSIAVDIEARHVPDVGERNRRLVQLSEELRRRLPGRTIGAIVLPPVVLDVVNRAYWPDFPYRALAGSYDVWLPMSYWTNRAAGSSYRDARVYTRENVERLRAHLERPDALVHPIGGIGDRTTAGDVEGYRRAVQETGSIGASLYDWRTTAGDHWDRLRALRS